ncbi:hypothetical protein LVO79_16070 [Roseivivax marinus]|uniref:DUF6931 family protein n=1 Tax=Roseivivax marinus TaxID=1379903 RepID=UPI001F0476FC|nr:hypothetical protein [Roseivivax marinus]UMA64504.1 hypothetical protein LVO79_16070 [Roseivivax marinus]
MTDGCDLPPGSAGYPPGAPRATRASASGSNGTRPATTGDVTVTTAFAPRRDAETTRPPVSALRYETPSALYAELPQVAQLTQHRPRPDEESLAYLDRLRASDTPEEALTFAAFAALPKMAIWWGYECVRTGGCALGQEERALMDLVAAWTVRSDAETRFRTMREGLYAPMRTPPVFLALAVGWSGGPIAPNDPAPVPAWRTPRAVNTAVLSCLAQAGLSERQTRLARFTEQAVALFRTA